MISLRTVIRFGTLFLVAAILVSCPLLTCSPVLYAQDGGDGGDGGVTPPDTGGGNTGTDTGDAAASLAGAAGVQIDAAGVLSVRSLPDARLSRQRLAQMRAALDPDIARPSDLRKVSLTRLEAVLAERIAAGAGMPDDMRYLAGLTRIEYVFFFPETGDIVVAGPAEGYGHDQAGRAIGLATGQAVLHLEDLIVALRAFPPGAKPTKVIGCSIDPTQEGLQRMREYIVKVSGRVLPSEAQQYAVGMRDSLGLQTVSVRGVSARTHFALALVEADYRMKLIGIGLESAPVKITNYIAKANPASVSRNALQRWYFVPDYESIRVSDDHLAMAMVGKGVKLVGENELVAADGARSRAGGLDRASKIFTTSFTKQFEQLAQRSPTFAQLRNVTDMAITAAYIQQEDFYAKANWALGALGREDLVPVELYNAPKQVDAAVNVVWKGRTLMTPIGGGVNIQAGVTLSPENLKLDEKGELQQLHAKTDIRSLPSDRWWWD